MEREGSEGWMDDNFTHSPSSSQIGFSQSKKVTLTNQLTLTNQSINLHNGHISFEKMGQIGLNYPKK